MKLLLSLLFACVTTLGPAAELTLSPPPVFPVTVTCFIGKLDSRSACSTNAVLSNAPSPHLTAAMDCGIAGQRSHVQWEFLGTDKGADVYRVTRTFPVDTLKVTTVTKEVRFAGQRAIVFQDAYQVIVFDPRK